jgi:membrane protein
MAKLLCWLGVSISWREILKRTAYEAFWKDNCLAMAAQLAYYFFFALFPTLLFLVALASYFPVTTLIDDMFRTLGGFVPPEALTLITEQIVKISKSEDAGLLSLGVLLALSSSSAAMTAIIDTLNRAYDIQEGRPWWKVRSTAILLTIATALFIVIAFGLVMVGPMLAEWVARQVGIPQVEWIWKIAQWPFVLMLIVLGVGLVYYFAPDAEQEWEWITPGALLATTLWLLASLGFRLYVTHFTDYNETYGSLGAIVVLMMWFYLSAVAILIGAEFNAEIEHASPHGKAPGEKVAGQKRQLGYLAARTHAARLRGENPDGTGRQPPPLLPAPAAPRGWLVVSIPLMLTRIFARKRHSA